MALRSTSAPVSAFWPKFGSVRENRVYPSSRTNRSTISCSHLNLDGSTNTSTSYCIDQANLHRMLWWSSERWELRKKRMIRAAYTRLWEFRTRARIALTNDIRQRGSLGVQRTGTPKEQLGARAQKGIPLRQLKASHKESVGLGTTRGVVRKNGHGNLAVETPRCHGG